jgi:S-adenosylmethionine:tRNA ribosyltransferase-isomerase
MSPSQIMQPGLQFTLPPELEAHEPPEIRGNGRDDVRMLVTGREGALMHARVTDLPKFLNEGDALAINVSQTLAASLPIAGKRRLHLSRRITDSLWVAELRHVQGNGTAPLLDAQAGAEFDLPGGASAQLQRPYRQREDGKVRLWLVKLLLGMPWQDYLERHGEPIRYAYAGAEWPVEFYRTSYGNVPGSAEMPSAGRALTAELLSALAARGVEIVPLTLHCGVSSSELWEGTQDEYFRVSTSAARRINAARAAGGRVICVGTTAVRALESAADEQGIVREAEGITSLTVTPRHMLRAADGLLTGWHEPQASHLLMLRAFLSSDALEASYRQALATGYLWHEFGDLQLIL